MSLINEALKKAQRLRTEDAADPSHSYPAGGSGAARRGKPQGGNTMILIGSGALALVVLSVFFTVYLLNRPSTSAPAVASATPVVKRAPAAPAAIESSAPAIVVPKTATPEPAAAAPESALVAIPTSPVAQTSAAVATATPSTTPPVIVALPVAPPPSATASPANISTPAAPQVAAPAPVAAAPAPVLPPDAPDERVAAFVEAVRVTGIRSSGAESRVLMNERVYRVNDIVERTMNVRLIKAASDSLTFSDARGVTYVKRF